jgi:hypothetical protein
MAVRRVAEGILIVASFAAKMAIVANAAVVMVAADAVNAEAVIVANR